MTSYCKVRARHMFDLNCSHDMLIMLLVRYICWKCGGLEMPWMNDIQTIVKLIKTSDFSPVIRRLLVRSPSGVQKLFFWGKSLTIFHLSLSQDISKFLHFKNIYRNVNHDKNIGCSWKNSEITQIQNPAKFETSLPRTPWTRPEKLLHITNHTFRQAYLTFFMKGDHCKDEILIFMTSKNQ